MKNFTKIFLAVILILTSTAVWYFDGYHILFSERKFEIVKDNSADRLDKNEANRPDNSSRATFRQDLKLKGEDDGRINILVLGVPGEGNNAPELTDTIIVFSIYPPEKKMSVVSIPRDLYVKIPESEYHSKINYLNLKGTKDGIGQNLIKQAIEEITGQKMHYYFLTDLEAIRITVDELGGINVPLGDDINDTRFPTADYGYEDFGVQKGWRYLDGKEALKYIRTRAFMLGDFERMRNQQAFLEALRKKLFGLNLVYDFPKLILIYKKVSESDHINTDLAIADFQRLYKILPGIKKENITFAVLDGEQTGLVTTGTVLIGNAQASVVLPKAGIGNYEKIREFFESF